MKQIVYQLVDNNPDTCVGEIAEGDIFRVEACGYCVVTTNDATAGPFPILIQTAPNEYDPLIINGEAAELTTTNNVIVLDLPGLYKVQVPAGTDTLVCVECFDNDDEECCDPPAATFPVGGTGGTTTPLTGKQPTTFLNTECRVDDINGDGSAIVGFVRASCILVEAGGVTSTPLGDFTDKTLSVPYVIAGTDTTAANVGSPAVMQLGRIELLGGNTWTPDVLVKSFTIRVHEVGDMNNPPTITDSFGNTTDMFVNETISYSDIEPLGDGLPVVTANTGDRVFITYQTLGV